MRRTLIGIAVAVLLVAATGVLLAQEARPPADAPTQLTAEQQAVLKQAQDLSKDIEINRLELRLAELKGASQDELAQKATEGYELRGKLDALWMKNPEVAREAWAERGRRRGTGRGMGPGGGMGQGMGRRHGRGGGGPGMGQGMGPGMGQGMGPGMGQGRHGRGMGQRMGPGAGMGPNCPMGPGMGQGRHGRGMGQGMGPGMGQGRHGRGMGQGMGQGRGQGFGRMRGQGSCPFADGKTAPPASPAPEPAPES